MSTRILGQKVGIISNNAYPKYIFNPKTREATVFPDSDVFDLDGNPLWGPDEVALEPRYIIPTGVSEYEFYYKGPEGTFLAKGNLESEDIFRPSWRYLTGQEDDRFGIDHSLEYSRYLEIKPIYGNKDDDVELRRIGDYTPLSLNTRDGSLHATTYRGNVVALANEETVVSFDLEGSELWRVVIPNLTDYLVYDDVFVAVVEAGNHAEMYVHSLETGAMVNTLNTVPNNNSPQRLFLKAMGDRLLVSESGSVAGLTLYEVSSAGISLVTTVPEIQSLMYSGSASTEVMVVSQGEFAYLRAIYAEDADDFEPRYLKIDRSGEILWVHGVAPMYQPSWMGVNPINRNLLVHVINGPVSDNPDHNAASSSSALNFVEIDGVTGQYFQHFTLPGDSRSYGWASRFQIVDYTIVIRAGGDSGEDNALIFFDIDEFEIEKTLTYSDEAWVNTPIVWSAPSGFVYNNGTLLWNFQNKYHTGFTLGWLDKSRNLVSFPVLIEEMDYWSETNYNSPLLFMPIDHNRILLALTTKVTNVTTFQSETHYCVVKFIDNPV